MKILHVEGWRGISHSYALVNQHQLLHLMNDARFVVAHRDLPLFRQAWTAASSGFGAQDAQRLENVPSAGDEVADRLYRISFPYRLVAGSVAMTYVFGTFEFQLNDSHWIGPSGTPVDADPNAVHMVTPSRWSRDGFIKHGFHKDRVHIVPHGVDTAMHAPQDMSSRQQTRASLGLPPDAFIFLNVGALTWNKGIDKLIAAFGIHRQRYTQSRLLLKGADALYGVNLLPRAIRDARSRAPLAITADTLSAIHYLGANLNLLQMAQLYDVADAYATPYRAEGFNLPALEAMAHGVPVIATRGGATDDFLDDAWSVPVSAELVHGVKGQPNAVYLEPDLQSLVDGLDRAVEDSALRERARREGPRRVAERYSWQTATRQLGDLLDR